MRRNSSSHRNRSRRAVRSRYSTTSRLARRLAGGGKKGKLGGLRADGKSQVTIEYHRCVPVRVDTVVVSTQHGADVSQEQIHAEIKQHVIEPVIPANMRDAETKIYIN